MGSGTVDFLLGAAVIALPQYQIPVLLGTASISILRSIRRRRCKHRKSTPDPSNAAVTDGGSTRQHVDLRFTDVRCSITNKTGVTKTILQNINGEAKPGRCGVFLKVAYHVAPAVVHILATLSMCKGGTVKCRLLAIMGPSGGGKTSLLNALAGQVPSTKGDTNADQSLLGMIYTNCLCKKPSG